jgi:hypothetical protein
VATKELCHAETPGQTPLEIVNLIHISMDKSFWKKANFFMENEKKLKCRTHIYTQTAIKFFQSVQIPFNIDRSAVHKLDTKAITTFDKPSSVISL